MLALTAPISVANVYPQTAVVGEYRFGRIEYIRKSGNECGWVPLQSNLIFYFIIALAVERWRCNDAIYLDPCFSKEFEAFPHIHM